MLSVAKILVKNKNYLKNENDLNDLRWRQNEEDLHNEDSLQIGDI